MSAITVVHWLAGLVVLAEALNKLERTNVLQRGLSRRQRLSALAKALAWVLLALGAGGAVITPAMQMPPPTLQDACVLGGFAVLIVRTRIKEECP